MKQLLDEDQSERQKWMVGMTEERMREVHAHDVNRRRIARQLLESGATKTGQDYTNASLIFQHGDTPQDYLQAHICAMAALSKGDANARWIAAATLDRYLHSINQPQVFGTQYSSKVTGGKPAGATQTPYDKDLVSDTLRHEFCVTPYAAQQENIVAMEQGKGWPSPDGCR